MLFILIGIYFAKTCITFCAPSLSLNLLKLACECEVRKSSCRDTYAPRCCYEINYSIAPRMHPDSSNEIKLDPDINFPRIIAYFPFTHFPICLRPRFVFWRNDLIIAARSTKKDSREFFFCRKPVTDDVNWPLYTKDQPQYFIFNADKNGIGKGPRATACAFWNDFLPKLRDNPGNVAMFRYSGGCVSLNESLIANANKH